jgi:hypothetical protein
MLDCVLMYFQVRERTKTTLEVLYKNHKKQSKHATTKKNMSVYLYLTIKIIMPAKVTLKMTLGIRA